MNGWFFFLLQFSYLIANPQFLIGLHGRKHVQLDARNKRNTFLKCTQNLLINIIEKPVRCYLLWKFVEVLYALLEINLCIITEFTMKMLAAVYGRIQISCL
jgi:hypothetical protein